MNISLDLLKKNFCLGSAEVANVESFHRFLFSNVLRLEKNPMCFEPANAEGSYFVVPLNSGKFNAGNAFCFAKMPDRAAVQGKHWNCAFIVDSLLLQSRFIYFGCIW